MPYMEGRAPEGEARAARSGSEVTSTSGARAWGVEDTATRCANGEMEEAALAINFDSKLTV